SFKGLRDADTEKSEKRYLSWKRGLKKPSVYNLPDEMIEEPSVEISGHAPGCTYIFISGVYTRRKRVEDDGSFSINVPLRIGQENRIRIMGLDAQKQLRSTQQELFIEQTGEEDDIEALVKLLSNLKIETFKNIQKDPGRYHYLCHSL